MGDKSAIEWTDATWNPVTGCSKVSQGCKFCYAKREWPRLSANKETVYFGREFEDVRVHPERLLVPLNWARPRRIFVNSMSDLFHEDVPFEFIDRVFGVMSVCGQHQFQILTKRPERALEYLTSDQAARHAAWNMCGVAALLENKSSDEQGIVEVHARKVVTGYPPGNVWIGTSVEDQETADQRIPILVKIPARVRYLSIEPLLGEVYLGGRLWVHWVIVGGESGPKARPMASDWVRLIRDQCAAMSVPFFFKQWGEWMPDRLRPNGTDGVPVAWAGTEMVARVGKKRAGRVLDGVTHDHMPVGI